MTNGTVTATSSTGLGIIGDDFKVVDVDQSANNSITIIDAQNTHTIDWPSGTTDQDITLDIDATPDIPTIDPVLGPYDDTGIGLEITASPSDVIFLKSFTITLGYRLVDLVHPDREDALKIAVYNESSSRWDPIHNSVVNTTARTGSASINHLSRFGLIQHAPSSALDRIVVFPNPFRSDLHSDNKIYFDFLTAGARVRIFDVSGELIRELTDNNDDGFVEWGLDTSSGKKVASGIYIYLATDASGNKKVGRLGVVR